MVGAITGAAAGHLLSPISQGCGIISLSQFYQVSIYQSNSETKFAYCGFTAQEQLRALYFFGQADPVATYPEKDAYTWTPRDTARPWTNVASSADGTVSRAPQHRPSFTTLKEWVCDSVELVISRLIDI